MKPFLLQSQSQFRSAGPFPLTSAEYAAEFNEVKSVGSLTSATRTMFQTNAALLLGGERRRGHGTASFARCRRSRGSRSRRTRASSRCSTWTAADALINVWDDKAFYGFWRPITAIREAHLDGNPATTADPSWLPLIANPPYPDHSSGRLGCQPGRQPGRCSTSSGPNDLAWTDTNFGGQTRSFTRASDAMNEVVDARVWSGIHFRRADVHGALIGVQVADWGDANYFRRLRP